MTDELQRLNHQFGLADHVNFKAGPGELTVAEINNAHAKSTIALQGGHVISFQPHGQWPVLWVSQQSQYKIGQAIRGGIPVAWPWFADHPTDPTKPAHGFVRTTSWSVTATEVVDDGATRLRLSLSDNDHSRALWPHAFRLELVITVGPALQVELLMQNPGAATFTCGAALHSYFGVSNASRIAVQGLAGCTYIDKVDEDRRMLQRGPVTIESETDRIYLETTATCVIEDPGWERRIQIAKSGSRSTVVWNPWIDKAGQIADFGDEEYSGMVCVETTNAAEDIITVAPGGEHRLRAVISLTP
jgi:D-hexose-6-phosphate mutarotase